MRYDLTKTGTTLTTLASDLLTSVGEYLGLPDSGQDEAIIIPLIEGAIQYVEDQCGIVLALSSWTQKLDRFPRTATEPICIQKPPVASIVSVTYTDDAGDAQTWATSQYDTDIISWPARVLPKPGLTYPVLALNRLHNVSVNFTAGYAAESSLHPMARQAILFLVSHWFHNREAAGPSAHVLPHAIDNCLNNLRWST